MSTPNQKLAKLLSNESFVRWINGNANVSEKQYWEAWERKDPANINLREEAEHFYQMQLELDPADDLELQLENIKQRIERSEQQKNLKVLKKLQSDRNMSGYRVAAAAAILLLMSGLSLLFLNYPPISTEQNNDVLFKTFETGAEESKSLTFSDGSTIQLNEMSSLRYNLEQFKGERLEVWLEGEGYFDIPSNPEGTAREFIVHTDDGKIQVLGTSFNVDTRFQKTSVVLEKGRVEVSGNYPQNIGVSSKILRPGERAVIEQSTPGIVVQKVNVGMFTAWINGVVEFQDTSLKEVFSAIEVIYNVELVVESPEVLNRRLTGNVHNPDLKIMLSVLQEILDLTIEEVSTEKYLISQ